MTRLDQVRLAFGVLRQLGVSQLANYIRYQWGLKTGLIERSSRRDLRRALEGSRAAHWHPLFDPPSPRLLVSVLGNELQALIDEAERICAGKICIFGSQVVDLEVCQEKTNLWFTYLERSLSRSERVDFDLKFVWEPARFGWVYPLGRAFQVQRDERYAEKFWEVVEAFLASHPPYYGSQWLSAQEVALRLIAWVFGYQVFQDASASTEERRHRLVEAIAVHAARIPGTVQYALAQNNNHLLSEAVGLMTAGTALRDHPLAEAWWKQGWRWFNLGIQRQIAEDGTYVQHSTNYHRLMLQLALWARLVTSRRGKSFPRKITQRLAEASRWLWDCCEPRNGQVPNLGPNDGASIQPLSQSPFEDFRPVLQAAYRAFVGRAAFIPGVWDEASLWYGVWDGRSITRETFEKNRVLMEAEQISVRKNAWALLRAGEQITWAALRCPRFFSRPTHADLLHVDLWWEGLNLACDAGTYRYTAPPPWNNSLAEAFYHNTITIDRRNPMTRAGRFLWLDWAESKILVKRIDDTKNELTFGVEHNGYRSCGVRVQRFVTLKDERYWIIRDCIEHTRRNKLQSCHWIRLHWLVYPFDWEIFPEKQGWRLLLKVNAKEICMRLHTSARFKLCLIEGGKVVFGAAEKGETYGYRSPTYNLLQPALSVILEGNEILPTTIETVWELPTNENAEQ